MSRIEDNPTPFEATADVTTCTENSIGYTSINVTDTNGQAWGPVSGDTTWTYNKDFTCSSNRPTTPTAITATR